MKADTKMRETCRYAIMFVIQARAGRLRLTFAPRSTLSGQVLALINPLILKPSLVIDIQSLRTSDDSDKMTEMRTKGPSHGDKDKLFIIRYCFIFFTLKLVIMTNHQFVYHIF